MPTLLSTLEAGVRTLTLNRPDSGVLLFLPALIGLGRAAEFYFSNTPINAETALKWGLVNRVVPFNLMEAVQSTAVMLAMGPIGAYGKTKLAFNKAMYPHFEEVLAMEADLQEEAVVPRNIKRA